MTLSTETENCMKEFVIENRLNCFSYSCFKQACDFSAEPRNSAIFEKKLLRYHFHNSLKNE